MHGLQNYCETKCSGVPQIHDWNCHFDPFYYFSFKRVLVIPIKMWVEVFLIFAQCIKKKFQTILLADRGRPINVASDASNEVALGRRRARPYSLSNLHCGMCPAYKR